ncbi:hemerythrin domain-containing protein [Streptomyces pactum]|uniref:Hemerythrin domain-containing protein n=1 Tax=Streptomyces pactum TaxID=68249 RepID=A0ABS0NII4_9ACTN|nr:hemerythrin domain-containing protein [Streptomyces pactum]MBH5334922.1 hemerythrin domain-containing protein [Streptomyces pactum]
MSVHAAPRTPTRPHLTMMYAIHDAFRRDAALLMYAAQELTEPGPGATGENGTPGDLSAIKDHWVRFSGYLAAHQMTEDIVLWPAVRAHCRANAWHMRLLDAMEDDHSRLLPLTEQVDDALAGDDRPAVRRSTEDFCLFLLAHLDREEMEALPLVLATVTAEAWAVFEREQRRQLGAAWAADFYPWLLDGAPEDTRREALRRLPVARRLAFHALWRPRYAQRLRRCAPVAG